MADYQQNKVGTMADYQQNKVDTVADYQPNKVGTTDDYQQNKVGTMADYQQDKVDTMADYQQNKVGTVDEYQQNKVVTERVSDDWQQVKTPTGNKPDNSIRQNTILTDKNLDNMDVDVMITQDKKFRRPKRKRKTIHRDNTILWEHLDMDPDFPTN